MLVANLAATRPDLPVLDTDDATFRAMYEAMVFPLHRLVRAVLPQMIARRRGKVVVVGSASALSGSRTTRPMPRPEARSFPMSRPSASRSRRTTSRSTPSRRPLWRTRPTSRQSYQRTETFKERMEATPIGRLAHGWESAALALFLAGEESDFFVGQVFPFAGGWVTR